MGEIFKFMKDFILYFSLYIILGNRLLDRIQVQGSKFKNQYENQDHLQISIIFLLKGSIDSTLSVKLISTSSHVKSENTCETF